MPCCSCRGLPRGHPGAVRGGRSRCWSSLLGRARPWGWLWACWIVAWCARPLSSLSLRLAVLAFWVCHTDESGRMKRSLRGAVCGCVGAPASSRASSWSCLAFLPIRSIACLAVHLSHAGGADGATCCVWFEGLLRGVGGCRRSCWLGGCCHVRLAWCRASWFLGLRVWWWRGSDLRVWWGPGMPRPGQPRDLLGVRCVGVTGLVVGWACWYCGSMRPTSARGWAGVGWVTSWWSGAGSSVWLWGVGLLDLGVSWVQASDGVAHFHTVLGWPSTDCA